MSHRAAVILIENGQIALIERHRQGQHYFTFPGGHVEPGETPEQTAVREAEEELGLRVIIQRLLAVIHWHAQPQYYYLVESAGGTFGTGTGEELFHLLEEKGTYRPVWVPLADLPGLPLLPDKMSRMVVEAQTGGWPDPPPVFNDDE